MDYRVMRCVFACQNELGRLCDEAIYQRDLALRLEAAGLGPAPTEVPVIVSHRGFSKTYYLDLIVTQGAIYELKAAVELSAEHEAQLLNYLFLTGTHHGKLVNFRTTKVQSRFVNTTLTPETRHQLTVDANRWVDNDKESKFLRLTFLQLLDDWGGFLELPLYNAALNHFLGGEEQVFQLVPVMREGLALGQQSFQMYSQDGAFRLTALPHEDARAFEQHLSSLLEHTRLATIHWINMMQHDVQMVTLKKK